MSVLTQNRFVFGMAWRRRRSFLILAFAVFLAVYFTAVMFLFAASIPQTLEALHHDRKGLQDAVLFNIGEAPIADLVAAGAIAEYGLTEILAEVEGIKKVQFSSLVLARFDQKALSLSGKRLLLGRLPQQAGEIALEKEALSLQRITASPGDRIRLTLRIPDGTDYLPQPVTKEFTLTGVLSDQRLYLQNEIFDSHFAYQDFPVGILSDAEPVETGGRAIRTAYIRRTPGNDAADGMIGSFTTQRGILMRDTGYQGLSALFSGEIGIQKTVEALWLAAFIGLLLMFAASLGIVNAFSGSLQQRKQHIGLLRAVGATRRQIRQIFGREALLLSVLTIPFALGLGSLTVGGVTRLLGPVYQFRPQPLVLAFIAVASFGSVWLAARIPLRWASRVPPLQVIRDVDLTRRMKSRRIRSQEHFRLPRLLAARNLKLYSSRLPGITVFMILSMILTMVVPFYFEGQLNRLVARSPGDYQLSRSIGVDAFVFHEYNSGGLNEGDISDIAALPGVASVETSQSLPLSLVVGQVTDYLTLGGWRFSHEYLNPPSVSRRTAYREGAYENYQTIRKRYGYVDELYRTKLQVVDPTALDRMQANVYDGSIHPDHIASGEEIVLVIPKYQVAITDHNDGGMSVEVSALNEHELKRPRTKDQTIRIFQNDLFQVGDRITLSYLYSDSPVQLDANRLAIPPADAVRVDRTVTIGALLHTLVGAAGYAPGNTDADIYPLTSTAGLTAMGLTAPYTNMTIRLNSKPDADLEAYQTDQLEQIAKRGSNWHVTPWLSIANESRRATRTFILAAGGIVLLLAAFAISLTNTTLSARVRAGRREIGTLRAVGASGREIMRVYDIQLAVLLGTGAILGIAAGWALCYWIARDISAPYPGLPVWQPLLFLLALGLVCRTNVWLNLRQIQNGSIVANIREL